jgi:hypothetical protein
MVTTRLHSSATSVHNAIWPSEVLIAANNATAAEKAVAEYLCDGTADEVQINAALAVDDKRPIRLSTGTFHTAAAITFVESGSSPILHDLIGASQDFTEIRANHTGNAVQIHSTQLPQEWRVTLANFMINKGATNTPARGLSITHAAHMHVEKIRVRQCTTNLYGDFCNTNAFTDCSFTDGVNGLDLTGVVNEASHHNAFTRCHFRANDVGVLLSDWAENNNFNNCTFDHTGTTDVGVKIPTGITKVQENNFIGCWFEGHTSSGTSYPLQLEGGVDNRFDKCRFAIATTQQIIKASGFASRFVAITDPYMDSGASFLNLPQGVTVSSPSHTRTVNIANFGARGDGTTNDTVAIQRAINALGTTGGVVTGPIGTYILQHTSTINHDSMSTGYCLKVDVDATHGPITFDFPRGTVFKLAASQATHAVLLLIDGTSAAPRLSPTTIRGITFDGNNTASQVAWIDFGLVTSLYSSEVIIEECTFKNANYAGLHILRDSRGVKILNNYFDALAFANMAGPNLRIEVQDVLVQGNRFLTDAVGGRHHVAAGDNADIDLQGRGMRFVSNMFIGGPSSGFAVDLAGVTHCHVIHNVFRDVCHTSSWALRIAHYTNQNGTYWEGAHNILDGNVFFNVRQGIQLVGGNGTLNGSNRYSSGAHSNKITNNIITRDYDDLRTQLGVADTYPDRFTPAPSVVAINLNVGIQEAGGIPATDGTGTATAGAASTLTDSTKSALWTTNEHQKSLVTITGGTGVGQVREIASNTTTVLTVSAAWTTVPDTTSTYAISNLVGNNEIVGNIIRLSNTSGIGITATTAIPSIFRDNTVYGTTAANAFQFGTSANAPLAIYSGNKAWLGDIGVFAPNETPVYRDEASGTAAITTGNTSVTVTHGLGRTPTFDQIVVWPLSDNGSATTWWVSAVTSTTFTISVDVNPAGTYSFAWRAFGNM